MAALSRLASGPHLGARLGPAFSRNLLARGEGQIEARHALDEDVRLVDRGRERAEIAEAPGQLLEEHAQREPGQVGTEAEVGAEAERDVRVRVAIEVDLVGTLEDGLQQLAAALDARAWD